MSEHLLLGGDNIDMALAYRTAAGKGSGAEGRAHVVVNNGLINRCRELKEKALAAVDSEDVAYTLAVSEPGGSLFTETRQLTIRKSEIVDLVLEGFFPYCEPGERPLAFREGLMERGLPYARDPAVTRHIAAFLEGRPQVDRVLFSGGTLTPGTVRERLIDQIARWQGGKRPEMLDNEEPFLAVAKGAALFARELALGRPRLIVAGASHGYYLSIDPEKPREAAYLVCILPLGTDIETPRRIRKLDLHLLVNRPVEFRLFSTVRREGDHAGQIVKYNDREFTSLPPMQTVIRYEAEGGSRKLPVELETRMNALGLLLISLVGIDGSERKWTLEFNIRAGLPRQPASRMSEPLPERMRGEIFALLESRFDLTVLTRIETNSGLRRDEWYPGWLREMWTPLAANIARRAQGVDYEKAWLNAAGFILRPGYGVSLDDFRMDQLWSLDGLGLAYPHDKGVREQWYIMWRRVCGGLDRSRQLTLFGEVRDLLESLIRHAAEAFRMAASFEYLPFGEKRELYTLLMEGVSGKRPGQRGPYLWSLGRLLGRVPLYGGDGSILPPGMVEECFQVMKDLNWREPGMEYTSTLFALACRKTGKGEVDITQRVRDRVVESMRNAGAREELLRMVMQFIPVEREDFRIIYGESLPAGIAIREFS